jgi:hypothetical protein
MPPAPPRWIHLRVVRRRRAIAPWFLCCSYRTLHSGSALGPAFARSCLWRTAQHAFNVGAPVVIEALNTLILLLVSLHLFPRCAIWLSPAVCSTLSPVRSRSCTSQSKVTVANRCDASCCITGSLSRILTARTFSTRSSAQPFRALATSSCSLAATRSSFCFFANYRSNHPSSSTYRLVSMDGK